VEGHNLCYSGTYNWTLWEGDGRVTITADVSTFADPLIAWTVNDEIINGVKTITADVRQGADPLSVLTAMPPETATLTCTATDRVLTIDNVRQGQAVRSVILGLAAGGRRSPGDDEVRVTSEFVAFVPRWRP
jgi:hypothetical protein